MSKKTRMISVALAATLAFVAIQTNPASATGNGHDGRKPSPEYNCPDKEPKPTVPPETTSTTTTEAPPTTAPPTTVPDDTTTTTEAPPTTVPEEHFVPEGPPATVVIYPKPPEENFDFTTDKVVVLEGVPLQAAG